MKNRLNPFLGTLVVIAMTKTVAQAASGTWDGSQNTGTWSDVLNWSALPGTGDTATFDNAGGTVDTIDLGAGVTIGGILFDTSSVAAYIIGSGTVGSQTLTLNNSGTITANDTINANQIFNAKLVLGTDATAQSYSITNNDASNLLTFAGGISGGTGGTAGAKTLNVSTGALSSGGITLSGAITDGGANSLALAFAPVSGNVQINMGNVGNTYSGGTSVAANVRLNVNAGAGAGLGAGDVTVATGGQVYLNSAGTYANNFAISGTKWGTESTALGALRFGNGTTTLTGDVTLNTNTSIGVDSGRAATITGNITGAFNLDKTSSAVGTGSPLTLTGTNDYSTTTVTRGVISFANKVSLYNTNTGKWTKDFIDVESGAGLALGVGDAASGYWDAAGVTAFLGASQMGGSTTTDGFKSGSLIGFDTTNAGGTFTYGAIGNIGTSATNGVLKLGSGTLILNATNTYTGATAVEGGTLNLASTGSISGTTVTVANGSTLVSAGSISGSTLTVSNGIFSSSGTALFSGAASLSNSDAVNTLATITGGTFSAASLSAGRTSNLSYTTEALAIAGTGSTTSGIYFNGGVTNISGAMTLNGSNSTASARIDSGALTVGGIVTIGLGNTGRWSVLNVNGGTFTSTNTATGIQLGSASEGNALFLVGGTSNATVEKITFNRLSGTGGYTGEVLLNGGSLYVGSGGMVITAGTNPNYVAAIKLTSGTLGAKADWSSSLNMTLGTNPIIQAADSSGTARNITLSGILSGTGFTKTGAGNLTLAGNTTNTYTGAAVLGAGSLILDNTTAAGGNNNTRLVDTSTLNLNGGNLLYKGADAGSTNSTETIGAITSGVGGVITVTYGGSNLATLTGASFVHTAGQASTLINGTNLGKNSTDTASVGKVILTSAPTLTGTTAALTSGINSAVKNTRIVPYFVGEATSTTGGLGTQTGTANTLLTYIAGSGLRPLNPTDEFTNNAITTGNNTYITSATAVSATAAINSLVINGADLSINDTRTLTNNSGAILFASSNAIKPTATSGALTFASGTEGQIYVNSGVIGTISAAITATGANALTKSGAGTLTLSGTNTYTGATTISAGKILNGSASAFTSKGALSMAGSGIFDLGGFDAAFTNVASSTTTSLITNNGAANATLTLTQTNQLNSLITDGTKALALKLTNTNSSNALFLLSSPNTFSGGITLAYSTGTGTRLRISSPITTTGSPGAITSSPYGTGAITVGTAATDKAGILLDTVNNITLANEIIVNTKLGTDHGASVRVDTLGNILSGKITANLANARFSVKTGGSLDLTGQITGDSGLEIGTTSSAYLGTVTLNNAGTVNNYVGDTTVGTSSINSVLALGAANQIPNGSGKGNVIVNGTLQLGGFSETINGLSGGSTGIVDGVSGTPTLTVGDNDATGASNTFGGVIKNTAGTLSLTKSGNGTLTLSNVNPYTGATNISNGTLEIAGSGSINSTSGLTISSGATFRQNSSVAYAGGTISNNGGTISGTGDIGVAVVLDSLDDKLAPGNSPGIQEYTIGQTWSSFTYNWETNNFTGITAGVDFDQLGINGSLSLTGNTAGSYAFDIISLTALNAVGNVANFSETNRQWTVLTTTGGVSGFNAAYWNINTGDFTSDPVKTGAFSLTADANNIYLNYTVIPEPSAALLGGLGILALLRRRRA